MRIWMVITSLLMTAFLGATNGPGGPTEAGADPENTNLERGFDRFPDQNWLRYVNVEEAGFSPKRLERARTFWEHRDSPACLVVSGGAVVASWGDVEQRFMCHSMRKSFLSALFGVFRDDFDLDMTLSDLNFDDQPPLTDLEKQARIVDLISSRSGVYHEAAAEPETMSSQRPKRGSHPSGSFWWYNNWDFNVAGAVFEQITGQSIFEAFGDTIARPVGMQDYRLSDGFYYFQHEKSKYPAYLFRMSTRDLARFGLLYAREGRWKDMQVIPKSWVEESTRSHSQVDMGSKYGSGYGYMWWVEDHQGVSARGSGGHILAVYPPRDLVVVIRADTYHDRSVSMRACMRLINMILDAKWREGVAAPNLASMTSKENPKQPLVSLTENQLATYQGEIELESGRKVVLGQDHGLLTIDYGLGVYHLLSLSKTDFLVEESHDPVIIELNSLGQVEDVLMEQLCFMEATEAAQVGNLNGASSWLRKAVDHFPESARAHYFYAKVLREKGKNSEALAQVRMAIKLDSDQKGAFWLMVDLYLRRFAWVIIGMFVVVVWLISRKVRRKPSRAQSMTS